MSVRAARHRPQFGHLALLVQVPGVDVAERVAAEKGSALDRDEEQLLTERIAAARAWLATYAPARARISVEQELPTAVAELSEADRGFLARLAERLADLPSAAWTGEGIQNELFEAARDGELAPGAAFAALYRAFLGAPSGPRAGWLLGSLEPGFVLERLRAAASPATLAR